jgi:hypothetical protein
VRKTFLFPVLFIVAGFDSAPLSAGVLLSSGAQLFGIPSSGVNSCPGFASPCVGSIPLPGASLTMNYTAFGISGFGVLASYAAISLSSGSATPGTHASFITLQGDSRFEDVFTFAGTGTGTVQFSFSLSGVVSTVPASATGDFSGNFAQATVYAYLPSSNTFHIITEVNGNDRLSPSIPVTFGQPIDIAFDLAAVGVVKEFQAGSSALSDFSHTAILNGISAFDSNGNPVPVVVTAQSQTQFGPLGIAPEPSTLALAAFALGAFVFLRNRRTS